MTERTDIIERLRDRCDRKFINALCEDAADEIERLTAEREYLIRVGDEVGLERDRLAAEVERLTAGIRDTIEALERNSTSAPVLETLRALEPKP